jgi:hypothetical protein
MRLTLEGAVGEEEEEEEDKEEDDDERQRVVTGGELGNVRAVVPLITLA